MSEIKNIVKQVLSEGQVYRDSDRHLVLRVWEMQGAIITPDFREWFMHNAIFPDSITRARREFQEKGLFPASPKVDEARFQRFTEFRGGGYIPI